MRFVLTFDEVLDSYFIKVDSSYNCDVSKQLTDFLLLCNSEVNYRFHERQLLSTALSEIITFIIKSSLSQMRFNIMFQPTNGGFVDI